MSKTKEYLERVQKNLKERIPQLEEELEKAKNELESVSFRLENFELIKKLLRKCFTSIQPYKKSLYDKTRYMYEVKEIRNNNFFGHVVVITYRNNSNMVRSIERRKWEMKDLEWMKSQIQITREEFNEYLKQATENYEKDI